MREQILFFSPSQCSGCGICEMVCSLQSSRGCSREASYIRVLRHPRLGTPVVAVRAECRKCKRCVQACTLEAIRFAEEPEWGTLIQDGWIACPVLDRNLCADEKELSPCGTAMQDNMRS